MMNVYQQEIKNFDFNKQFIDHTKVDSNIKTFPI